MPEARFDTIGDSFLNLADTPETYDGAAGYFLRVRPDGQGVYFSRVLGMGEKGLPGFSIGDVVLYDSGNWSGDSGVGISPYGIYSVDASGYVSYVLVGIDHPIYVWFWKASETPPIQWTSASPGAGWSILAAGEVAINELSVKTLNGYYMSTAVIAATTRIELAAAAAASAPASGCTLYCDSADNDLKVVFANGTRATLATD